MTTWDERKAQYNKHYHTTYSGHVNTDGVPSVTTDKATECSKIIHDSFKPASVLDCGCATGWLLHGFLQIDDTIKVAGFDISDFVVKHTYENLRDKLMVLDITSGLPYGDGEFGLVLGFDILEHLQDYEAIYNAVGEMCRVSSQWIMLRQPMVRFVGLETHQEICDWIAGLNVLPHRARLALVGVAKEITTTAPESKSLEHPNEHPRGFWLELFRSFGYKEWTLPEAMYYMPNALHLHSFDTIVFKRDAL